MFRTTLPPSFRTTRFPSTLPSTLLRAPTRRPFTKSLPSSKPTSRPSKPTSRAFTFSSRGRPSPLRNATILQNLRNSIRTFRTSRRRLNGLAAAKVEEEPTTLGGRLKKLSREYGWSALGVYFALSALDFPFCYLLVTYLGTERIGRWEHYIVSNVKAFIPDSVKQTWNEWRNPMRKTEHAIIGSEDVNEHIDKVNADVKADKTSDPTPDGWGVDEAMKEDNSNASLGTKLALAYAIHKSFIFLRIPLTAAILPKVVGTLRGWGWDIGRRTTKEAKALKRASMPIKKPRARLFRARSKPKTK